MPFARLAKRFLNYSFVGTGTFLLDLLLIYILKSTTSLEDSVIVGLAFLVAVSINFVISYYFVFRGTSRDRLTGYLSFLFVAVIGMQIIIYGTISIQAWAGINLYAARIIMSSFVGVGNFAFNNFINLKTTTLPE
jgi:putative flippase GtrA